MDDSKVIRMVARKIIQEIGLDADEAGNGYDGLEACEAAMPDAVLLDWNMPGMSGVQFLRTLRAMPGGDRPVVIYCTTQEEPSHIDEALSAGASDYLMKPFDGESLLTKLTQMGMV